MISTSILSSIDRQKCYLQESDLSFQTLFLSDNSLKMKKKQKRDLQTLSALKNSKLQLNNKKTKNDHQTLLAGPSLENFPKIYEKI